MSKTKTVPLPKIRYCSVSSKLEYVWIKIVPRIKFNPEINVSTEKEGSE